jgi:hypothetical protein
MKTLSDNCSILKPIQIPPETLYDLLMAGRYDDFVDIATRLFIVVDNWISLKPSDGRGAGEMSVPFARSGPGPRP